ncbi:MAG: hypothetical protein M0T75_03385, partial [Chloroflexi bacterium]|nr:hypothetical protein [Chloroflexota bacterium]
MRTLRAPGFEATRNAAPSQANQVGTRAASPSGVDVPRRAPGSRAQVGGRAGPAALYAAGTPRAP